MTQLIERFEEISGQYDALLCDLWGCYHNGLEPYTAAVAALRAYRARGGRVILLTNAPRPIPGVQRFLDKIGAPEDTHDAVLSSGEICAQALAAGEHGQRVYYLGPDRDLGMLETERVEAAPVEEAEAILCTGLRDDRTETPADYAEELAAWVARGLPMICANPDIVVDRGETRLWCAGALAREYGRLGGRVHYYGKPHGAVYAACLKLLEQMAGAAVPKARVLCIGDGIQTDVAGAAAAGIDAVFVTAGIAAAEFGPDLQRPDPERLAAFLTAEGQAPRYAIPYLS